MLIDMSRLMDSRTELELGSLWSLSWLSATSPRPRLLSLIPCRTSLIPSVVVPVRCSAAITTKGVKEETAGLRWMADARRESLKRYVRVSKIERVYIGDVEFSQERSFRVNAFRSQTATGTAPEVYRLDTSVPEKLEGMTDKRDLRTYTWWFPVIQLPCPT